MSAATDYLATHQPKAKDRNCRREQWRVTRAIARLIEKHQLDWDPVTDKTTVTQLGESVVAHLDWWMK